MPHLGTRAAQVIAAPQEAWRSDTAQRKRAYARRRGIDITKLKTVKQLDQALEKVIGDRDFLPSRWLRRAANAAEAVARVRTPADFGTGFLVTPWLLMTNHHVLDSVSVAEVSTVTFRYEEDDNEELHDTVRLALQPERCFVTSPIAELDLTLVAVAPTPDGEPPGKTFGHIVAPGPTGKVLLGQPVNILQHPDGRPREIAVRNNLLLSVDDDAHPDLRHRHRARLLRLAGAQRPVGAGRPAPQLQDRGRRRRQRRDPGLRDRRPHPHAGRRSGRARCGRHATRRRCSVSSSIWGRSKGRGSAVRRGGPRKLAAMPATSYRLLSTVRSPQDLRGMAPDQLEELAEEIRRFLVDNVSQTGGHLGPNLGVVELTIALHRVFESPRDPMIFDTGHQSYVHKILTGRQDRFPTLRQRGGLSGYPSPAESEHDWVGNSHASTALSYADGLAKALRQQGRPGTVVAFVGDGSLTGGMAWEALNNITAAGDLPLVIVVNDNGRSYTPTVGGLANHLSGLRTNPRYEQILDVVRRGVSRAPLVGGTAYDLLHGIKIGLKDVLAPQGMFSDLGLKYVGPIDGHDIAAVERALHQAKQFGGPVLVHCVTRKGNGFKAAEDHEEDRFHAVGKIDAVTGASLSSGGGQTWTDVFSEELLRLGSTDERVVAITAAMLYPTGLHRFATAFPDRCFDVGIAEQHAVTSAAGMALGGLHPVVAIYSTFLNRAFDQLLMDVALHRCGVTFVLDRAGITGTRRSESPRHVGLLDPPARPGPAPGGPPRRHPTTGGTGPVAADRRRALGAAILQGPGAGRPARRGDPGRSGRPGREPRIPGCSSWPSARWRRSAWPSASGSPTRGSG